MTEIKIEKSVPVPKGDARKKYPFAEMKKGESFFVECGVNGLRACASHHAIRNPGKKFTVRKEGNGARCWRVE